MKDTSLLGKMIDLPKDLCLDYLNNLRIAISYSDEKLSNRVQHFDLACYD